MRGEIVAFGVATTNYDIVVVPVYGGSRFVGLFNTT
jgi:hypothetical protein